MVIGVKETDIPRWLTNGRDDIVVGTKGCVILPNQRQIRWRQAACSFKVPASAATLDAVGTEPTRASIDIESAAVVGHRHGYELSRSVGADLG